MQTDGGSVPVDSQLWQSADALVGKLPDLMVETLGVSLHPSVVEPFTHLRAKAAAAGFDLRIASGFRSFERQLAIWNAKASGQRKLLDAGGRSVEYSSLTEEQLIHVILRWSALPGASRHHWGSDLDVFDAAAVPADYQVQLTPFEVEGNGPFAPLHRWLDEQFSGTGGDGFFRPYDRDRGGVAPERWHISYAPLASRCQAAMSPALIESAWRDQALVLKEALLPRLSSLYHRYVAVPSLAYPEIFRRELSASGG